MIKSQRKNAVDLSGVKTATSCSPVWYAPNWATEDSLKKKQQQKKTKKKKQNHKKQQDLYLIPWDLDSLLPFLHPWIFSKWDNHWHQTFHMFQY